jgi:hypothetical protein
VDDLPLLAALHFIAARAQDIPCPIATTGHFFTVVFYFIAIL